MIRILFTLLFFIYHSFIFSEANNEENSYLIDLQGMPSSMVAGCVNAITGNYCESHLDLQVNGSNPIPLISSYHSSKQDKGTLCSGWDINLPGDAVIARGESQKHILVNHGGSYYSFCGNVNVDESSLDDNTYKYGVTNAHHGRLTAREKLSNTKFTSSKGSKHGRLVLSANEELKFKEIKRTNDSYFEYELEKHYLPNRCNFEYSYTSHKLSKVKSIGQSGKLIGHLSFVYPKKFKDEPKLTIVASDKRTVEYNYKKVSKDGYFLDNVNSPHIPRRSYKYCMPEKSDQVRLYMSELPDSRYTNILYYEKGVYDIWGRLIEVKGSKDSRSGRVSSLRQPVGTDDSGINTFSFIYHLNKDKVSSRPIGGHTEVFDAYANRTVYSFSKEHRLEGIEHFRSNGELYRHEEIYWGKTGSDYTLLKNRSLKDANGKLWLERFYRYDHYGNSKEESVIGDLTGNKVLEKYSKTYTYTKHHQVATENDGRKEIRYRYCSETDLISSKLILENSHIKQRVFFTYDANGALTSEIIDDGTQKSVDDLTGVTQRLIKRIQTTQSLPVGLPEVIEELCFDTKTQTEWMLRRTTNTYSPEGTLLVQNVYDSNDCFAYSKSWTYNSMGKVSSEVDPTGQVTHYEYDANGNCILKKIDNTEYYTSYVYDFSNRLIREEDVYSDGLQLAKTYSYDLRGNKTAESDVYGNITNYHYDEFNRLVEISRPPIVTADGTWHRPKENFTYNVLNNITSKTDGNGNITYIYCTALGKPCRIVYPDGTCEQSIYNTDGTQRKLILPNGSYILYDYDYLKRIISEETYSANGEFLCKETRQYNAFNLISQTDRKGSITNFTYDAFGRLISGRTDTMETRFVYDSLGRQTEIWELVSNGYYKKTIKVLDLLDRVIEERVEDSLGTLLNKRSYQYDNLGNKTEESIYTSQGKTTKFTEYNALNQAEKIIHPNGEISYVIHNYSYHDEWGNPVAYCDMIDPLGNRISHVYNTHGKLAAEEYYAPTGTLLKKLYYRYDLAGNLVRRYEDIIVDNEVTDTVITTLEYDSRNRETGIIKAYGRAEQKIFRKEYTHFDKIRRQIKPDGVIIEYIYDWLGRLVEVFDTAGTVHYVYTYDLNDNVLSVTDKVSQTMTTREFDGNNLLLSETQDNGLLLRYQHDQLGRIEILSLPDNSDISYSYDALSLKSITRKNYTQTYDYDLSGRPSQITLPENNGTLTFHYDQAMRLTSVESNFFSQSIPENGYDANDNILTLNQSDALGNISSNYAYDALNQLVSEEGIATHTYEYDSRQNRSKKDENVYENDILSQLVTQGNASYGYDPNGNRSSLSRPNQAIACEYDALDRLIHVTNGPIKVRYKYDAFNRRMSKATSVNGVCTEVRYLYSGDNEIGSVSADGCISELMIAAGSQPAMLEVNHRVYLPILDHRGNVASIIDALTHSAVETYRYSSFGEEELFDAQGAPISVGLSPWRFSGKRIDPETGWVYFGRRHYDPEVGRWTTPDPLWFEDGPNLYAYVQNNPIIFVDPNGLKHQKADISPHKKSHWNFCHYEKIASILKWSLGAFGVFANVMENRSRIYEFGEANKQNSRVSFCFINGVFNSFDGAQESAELISNAAGGAYVRGVYNCSNGVLDLVECAMGLLRIDTDPVAKLHQLWDEEFARLGKDGIIAQLCHSQGAIHVRNALETYDPIKRMRIHVLAVAPAAYISREICGSVTHLVSNWDFVPLVDYFGRKINADTIVKLDRHFGECYFDHFFNSQTYNARILEFLDDVTKLNGGIK